MYARLISLAAAGLVTALSAMPAAAQVTERPSVVRHAARGLSPVIPGRFIVTVAPRNDPGLVASAAGIRADRVYRRVLNGFAASLSDLTQSRLLYDYRVVSIEPDRKMTITVASK